uniref:Uncharacterized protein n=2 Tax=viral metagenome TaxID=1070528 RepID=A0A6M3XAC5_9ZZZZ
MSIRAEFTNDLIISNGVWVDARAYGSALNDTAIQAAITVIGADNKVLVITPGTWTITNNLSIPANITVMVMNGGLLSVGAAKKLTIIGPLDASNGQVFAGDGTVDLSAMPGAINALWFAGSDIGAKLNGAIAAGGTYFEKQTVIVPTGIYSLDTCVNLAGKGAGGDHCHSTIDFQDSYIVINTSGTPAFDCIGSSFITFRGGKLRASGANTPSSCFFMGPNVTKTNSISFTFSDIKIWGTFSKAAIIGVGLAPLFILGDTWVYNAGLTLSLTRRNSQSEVSVYDTIHPTLPQDSISLHVDGGVAFAGADVGDALIELEGNTNRVFFNGCYMSCSFGNCYLSVDATTDPMWHINLINVRTEFATAPVDGIKVIGTNAVGINVSGGIVKAATNLVNAPDCITYNGAWGVPHRTFLRTTGGCKFNLKQIGQLDIDVSTGVKDITATGEIVDGLTIYGGLSTYMGILNILAADINKIKWNNPRGPNELSHAMADLGADQAVNANTTATVEFSNQTQDVLGEFDPATFKFTPILDGYYHVDVLMFADVTAGDVLLVNLRSAGFTYVAFYMVAERSIEPISFSCVVPCTAGTDIYVNYKDATNASTILGTAPYKSYITITRVAD